MIVVKNLKFLKPALFLLCFAALNGCNQVNSKPHTENKTQSPNIINILADDLGYGDLSFLGQTRFETPNIDKMAAQGMVFTQHYSGATVCAPSRSALLTGLHTGHTPIRGNHEIFPEGQYPLPDSTYTLPEMLKEQGYTTGLFGKWGLGYPGSEGVPNKQGFDKFYGYNCQRLAHHYYPYYLWNNNQKVILEGNTGKNQNDYAPDLIHKEALNFMEVHKDTSFFMFYATPIPHAELLIPEEHMEPFKESFLPEKIYEGIDDGEQYRLGPYGSQPYSHAAFAAMVTLLDKQVGEILDKVEALGIAENTIIMFSSDNGPHEEGGADPDYFNSNGPFKGVKRDLYEGGIHVPMIAQWKGKIVPGSSSNHVSAFWDVFPTLAELSGSEKKYHIDGISFAPTLLGKEEQPTHNYLYWEFHSKGGRQAIRKDKWKGVLYNITEGNTTLELYDLSIDPEESTDLSNKYPEIANELSELMKNARTESEIFKFETETYDAGKN